MNLLDLALAAALAEAFAGALSAAVAGAFQTPEPSAGSSHANGRLRTGQRGRPAHVDTFIDNMAQMTARAMRHPRTGSGAQYTRADYRDRHSQLSWADALLVWGSDLVAVSLKINAIIARREAWRDVPLWITVSGQDMSR